MAFSRRQFIQTGVGGAVAVAASVAGAEAIHTAAGNMISASANLPSGQPANEAEIQAANLPPSPQAAGQPPAQGPAASQSPVTWAGEVQVNMAPDRMPEIPADKMTDAQKKAAEEFAAGRGTPPFGPFVPLLRSPEVMLRAKAMGDYLRYKSTLAPKVSEFAILITARHYSQEYEWAVHYPIAVKAGVNADLLGQLAEGRRVRGVYETDQLVYEFVSELLTNTCVCDTTYHWAVQKLGEQSVIDLVALVGYYAMLALVMNTTRTAIPKTEKPALALFPR
jgi:4-carboxymuconolactone decarboxylase